MMNEKKTYRFFTLLIYITMFLIVTQANSQTYADKKYYLIDSLNLEKLSSREKKLLDSSLTLYHKYSHDSLKIKALNIFIDESWNDEIWPKYNKWVYNYVQEKLNKLPSLSEQEGKNTKTLKLLEFKAQALNNFGVDYSTRGDYLGALEYHRRALKLSENIAYKIGAAATLHNIAYLYRDQGKISKSLEYYLKSLKISESLGDKKLIGASLNNIALVYTNQDNVQKALEYYNKSLSLRQEVGDKVGVATTVFNMASLYQKSDSILKSLEYYRRSMKIWENLNYKKGIANSMNKIGSLLEKEGKYNEALEKYKKGVEISEAISDRKVVAVCLTNIGSIYFKQNNVNEAKKYAHKSLGIAQDIGHPVEIKDAAELLSKIYQHENNWKESFKMERLFITMRDSIRNVNTEKDVIRQQASYETDKKEQEIVLLSTQNEVQKLKLDRNKILIVSFSIGFGLALILIVVTYRGYKKKQVVNQLLEQQKEEISKKNEEKKAMLKEIHHRVKNNLQVVNSLLKLQSREIADENVVAMFKEAQNRVLSMAMIHEKMYSTDDIQLIDVQEHFKLLVHDLVESYAVGKKIDLDINVADIKLGIRTLVPLGLIVNELITNSLKYAFKDRNQGKIIVGLKHLEDKEYELIIGDDGVGFKENEVSSGLGAKLVNLFVKQLNGVMKQIDREGVLFKIVFENLNQVH